MKHIEVLGLENLLSLCFVNDEFIWDSISLVFGIAREGVTEADILISACEYITNHLKNADIRSQSPQLSRLIDLLVVIRDPTTIRNASSEGFSDEVKTIVKHAMEASLKMRRECENFNYCSDLNIEHFSKAMFRGDVPLMEVLLRFGIQPPSRSKLENNGEKKSSYQRRKISVENSIVTKDDSIVLEHKSCEKCQHNAENTVEISLKSDSRRDMFIGTAVLAAFTKSMTPHSRNENALYKPNVDKCHRLYFQVIPEPVITYKEIEKTVDAGKMERDEKYWESFLQKYKQEYPESMYPYQPRSLVHLCRCQVRNDFAKVGLLPNLVSKLEMPLNLKRLLLADTEDFIC